MLKKLRINRAEFEKLAEEDIVSRQYAAGYGKYPQTSEEIEEWEEVQFWEDE